MTTPAILPLAKGLISRFPKVTAAAVATGAVAASVPFVAQWIRDVHNVAPTRAAAANTVISRAWVESPLATLDITPNLLKGLQVLYAEMLLIILQRGNEISAGRTVADSLSKIQTRGMGLESFTDFDMALEQASFEVKSLSKNKADLSLESQDDESVSLSAKDISAEVSPPDLLPTGQVLKVSLTGHSPDGKPMTHDVLINVRVTPYVVNSSAMEIILSQGSKPSFQMRKLQWKAGEISFWKDLVFQADRVKKVEDAIRKDKTGAYAAYVKDSSGRDTDRLLDILANIANPRMMSNNLANSIIVTSEDAIKRAAADTGFDLMHPGNLQRFFNNSYVMLIAVVDPNYHRITLYMNGRAEPEHYAFSDFAPKKKNDASDYMQLFAGMMGQNARSSRF